MHNGVVSTHWLHDYQTKRSSGEVDCQTKHKQNMAKIRYLTIYLPEL